MGATEETDFEDPQRPLNEAVLVLFSTLVNLQRIRLRGSTRIASLLLSPLDERRFPFLSKLRVLQLAASFGSHPDPIKFVMESTLRQYRALFTLALDVRRVHSSIEAGSDQDITNSGHLLPALGRLCLQGPIVASQHAQTLIKSTPAITDLVLVVLASSLSAIKELLNCVQQPHSLEALTIAGPNLDILPSEILQPMHLFTNLASITLDLPASFEDFLPVLSKAPLLIIELGWFCIAQLTALSRIISGTTKIQTLVILKLDTVTAKRGKPVPRDIGRQDLSELDLDALGWKLPDWYDEFSREDFEEFLKLAEKESVMVTGKAVEALEVEDEWEEEMKYYRSVTES